jgi:hypothetical protein
MKEEAEQAAPPSTTGDKKLKSSKVKDAISKSQTITGGSQDTIKFNPVQEAAEKHAVFAFGRFNAPTIGHEKLIKHVEATAKEVGGSAHIIASHSEGTAKNPIPVEKKVGYLKKVAAPSTQVSSSSKEEPTLLHHLVRMHNSGVQHLTMVAGSDRVPEYEKLIHHYNGVQSRHGLYNFKSVRVVSAGQRDPDAEGATGMSGTKLRALARAGDTEGVKKGLPKALHPHAHEIINQIQSIKESEELDIDDAFEFMLFAESVNDVNPNPKYREAVPRSGQDRKKMQLVPRDDRDRKSDDRPYRLQSIVKKIIDERAKPVWERPAPEGTGDGKMTAKEKAEAKASAKAAGRPYPNLVDNLRAMK